MCFEPSLSGLPEHAELLKRHPSSKIYMCKKCKQQKSVTVTGLWFPLFFFTFILSYLISNLDLTWIYQGVTARLDHSMALWAILDLCGLCMYENYVCAESYVWTVTQGASNMFTSLLSCLLYVRTQWISIFLMFYWWIVHYLTTFIWVQRFTQQLQHYVCAGVGKHAE